MSAGRGRTKAVPVWAALIAISVMMFLVRGLCPYDICRVYGESMYPSYTEGDLLLVKKINLPQQQESLHRYDVIITGSPDGRIIKRVAGLPGEEIKISGDGDVYANGELLEDLSLYQSEGIESTGKEEVFLLDGDSYFVLGDNPNHSLDSREFGPFKGSQVYGTVIKKL